MSELLQSGQQPGASGPPDPHGHPDADQLSAFMEQALPLHERDYVLAHLAVCPDCRETVAFALPPTAAPARKPWFTGWTVFLPAALALAALALFVVYINHEPAGSGRQQAQNAVVPSMAPLAPQDRQAGSAATSTAQPSSVPRQESSEPAQSVSDEKKAASAIAIDKISQLPVTNRAIAGLSNASPPPSAPGSEKSGQSAASGAGMGGSLGSLYGSTAAPAPPEPAFANARLQPAPAAAPPPPSPQRPPEPKAAPASTETVQVASAAAPIETANAELKDTIQPADQVQSPVLRHRLPSRLTLLSLANAGSRVLAIDARNAVFLSADGGRHWKPVPIPWQGHAVKAELVSQVEVHGAVAGSLHGTALDRFSGRALSPASDRSASLAGTVTDRSGAVVSGATVVVTGGSTGTTRTVRADANGRYLAAGLAPGAYKLEAQAPGFQLLSLNNVMVDASRPNLANLTLDVGSVTETVTVDAAVQSMPKSSNGRLSAVVTAPAAPQAPLVFAITTDTGERWTSVDGLNWKRN